LAGRRLGDDGVHDLAARQSLDDALRFLMASSYGQSVRADFNAILARHAITETTLWNLRVLAGWLPPRGVDLVRKIAGWFEILNIEGHAVALVAGTRWSESPVALGALATVWSEAKNTASLDELRATLARSPWNDPGGATLADILLGLRLGWARWLRTILPDAASWGDGALALAIAKGRFLRPADGRSRSLPRIAELGSGWRAATDVADLARRVPSTARWVFADVHSAEDLWQAEHLWWERVDHDAASLLRHARLGRTVVVVAAMLLVTDCWRVQAALDRAARGRAVSDTAGAKGWAHAIV
jgi:hypothetical protein